VREGALLRAARRLGYSTVAHLHGSGFVEYAAAAPGRVRRVLRAASRVYVLSDETRDCVLQFVPADRLELVPNAVPAGSDAPKRASVVFGGSVSRRKGVDVLVSAWSRLSPDAWSLEIVGPTADAELVDDDLAGATFRGALPHEELMSLLERASIAVLPSREEAMPMFILEALARRTAVVATRVGGIPDVLSDGAGVLVDPGDIDGLAKALGDLMRHEDLRETVVRAGGEKFDRQYSARALNPRLELSWASALGADRA
jgi:glycosyltransferase involved in cell wall biosynthesis